MKIIEVETQPMDGRRLTSHAYFFPKNESVLENLANRRSRPSAEYKALLLEYLHSQGITGVKPVWSQRCGCSCGCSPGFRINGLDNYFKDFFFTVAND